MSETSSPISRSGAARVIKALVGWLLLWFATSIAAAVIVGLVYGVQGQLHPPVSVLYVTAAVASPVAFAFATWRRAGFDAARLGFAPIRRLWLLILFSIATVLQLPAVGWLIRALSPQDVRHFGYGEVVATGNAWTRVPLIVVAVAIAPVVEEVLFRGWLWTDLRRYWSATSIMLFTGLVFVLVHVADDYRKIYTLLPLTVILSLARQFCGSVKATIWLHLLNNAVIAGALLYAGSSTPLSVHLSPHGPMP